MSGAARRAGQPAAAVAVLAAALVCGCSSALAGGGGGDAVERRVVALHAEAQRLREAGELDQAAEHLRQAAIAAEEARRPALAAALLLRLGNLLTEQAAVQKAVVAYEQGLRHLAADGEFGLTALLADLRAQEKGVAAGPLTVADDLYTPETAAELAAARDDPTLHLQLLLGVGNAYLGQSQDAVALEHFDRALERPDLAGHPELRARLLTNSAVALRRLGRHGEARERLGPAVDLLAAGADPGAARSAVSTLASIELETGDPEAAVRGYARAAAAHEAAGDERGLARALTGLGRAQLAAGRGAEAIAVFERALALARTVGDTESRLFSLLGLGVAYRAAGRVAEAAEALEEARPLVERRRGELRTDEGKVAYLDSVASIHEELVALHLARTADDPSAWERALAVSEAARGRALDDLVGSRGRDERMRFPPPGTAEDELTPQVQSVRGTPVEPPAVDVRQVAAGTVSSPPPAMPPPRWIDRREPAPIPRLSFHVLADRTAVFFVAADGRVTGHVAEIGRDELLARLDELRRALGVDASLRGARNLGSATADPAPAGDPEAVLAGLYRALIAPLEPALPAEGTTLAVLPHGPLWLFPLAALADDGGRTLSLRWPLLHATSRTSLDEIRAEVPKDVREARLLAVGNPAFGEASWHRLRLEPLPGAEREVRELAALAPDPDRVELLVGPEATYDNLVLHLAASDIVHLATHGLADDDEPLSSLLLLAGGDRLTARTVIRELDVPAQLVVLSACQTGLGRSTGDGTVGLSRSFLAAGARSVVMSLWSIDDAATARFMEVFYRAYFAGDSKARALQRAMERVRSEPGWSSPAYWSPFVLVGAED